MSFFDSVNFCSKLGLLTSLLGLEESVTYPYPLSIKSSPHIYLLFLLASFIYGQVFLLTFRIKLFKNFLFLPCVLHIPTISFSFGYHPNNVMGIIDYSVTHYVPAYNLLLLIGFPLQCTVQGHYRTDTLKSYNPKPVCKTLLPFTVSVARGGDRGSPYLTYIVVQETWCESTFLYNPIYHAVPLLYNVPNSVITKARKLYSVSSFQFLLYKLNFQLDTS